MLPASDYREQKVQPDDEAEFDELMCQATSVQVMPFAHASGGSIRSGE